ncbi:voltage-gated chloride channel protein ClcB [Herbaspirillum rubrisubalbicans]|uniref:Voltage-gated chloride channel protein ClcB n=1 Tax=Herbaspirillum rubrisubalbicans TaxID=80842 RepID=A0ABX9C7K8_9BURK|nr:ClcB-like voltage-gated chloride channel protein [Herbaspirillum rubrisubalbicans]RAM66530.1 voltage-gated chloride channel protein ClcB [Herbaspirillum rubrisubalbicans]RAN50181.1 voltage-gated chloride channel protein ClcB [Herbaspirillum rubrisubalbicans]
MHELWIKYRLRVLNACRVSETHSMLLWGALAGFVGALATIAFRECIALLQIWLTGHDGSFVDIAKGLPWHVRVLLPTCGGVVAGLFLVWAKKTPAGNGGDYMEAVAIGDGAIPVRNTLLRSISSLASIASGGSIGREGPMVQLSALCASLVGKFSHFPSSRLRLLVACGAAAGITSAYNAPIAGAFFITEIVLGSLVMESFGPVMVASVVANITMRELPGYRATYEMPYFPEIGGWEVLLFLVLGVLAGILAPQFLRVLELGKHGFAKFKLPLPVRLGVGGLLVGLISIQVPEVWGNGYSLVNSLLHTTWLWQIVLMVLVIKVLATAITVGSGAVGGIFTPTLFVGAAVGYLFGDTAQALLPMHTSQPFAYAMVGMGAFLAAASYAPLMAILMIFEMTLSYQVVLPLMLSCVVAYVVARSVDGRSMYEITLKRHRDNEERLRLRGTHMSELIRPAETVLMEDASLEEVSALFLKYPVKYVYIVDAQQRYQGVVALQDITSWLLDKKQAAGSMARDFLRPHFLHEVTPDMSLGQALQLFLDHQGERLPVIASAEDPRLLGVVFKTSLLDAYFRLDRAGN